MACGIYTPIETCHSLSTEIDPGACAAVLDDVRLAAEFIGTSVVANASTPCSAQATLDRSDPPA